MSKLPLIVAITRTELGLPNIYADEKADGYEVVSWTPGAVTQNRRVATSPLVAGEFLIASTRNTRSSNLVVRVSGSTSSEQQTRLADLIQAMEQFAYGIYVTIDGVQNAYGCQPADWSVGDPESLNKFEFMVKKQTVRFVIPTTPANILGGF